MIWFLIVFYCNRGWKKFRNIYCEYFRLQALIKHWHRKWIEREEIKIIWEYIFLRPGWQAGTTCATLPSPEKIITRSQEGLRQTSKGFIQGYPFSCNVLSFGKDYVMLMRKVMIMVIWWWFFWWWWWRWWQWWWWRSWSGWWWWWWCIRSFWICNGCSCVTLFAAFAELQINCNNWNAISPNRASSSTWSSSM